jgi:hypothetical protein
MQHYNVIVDVPLQIDVEIHAEDEHMARVMAVDYVNNDLIGSLQGADSFSHNDPEVIESWELSDV